MLKIKKVVDSILEWFSVFLLAIMTILVSYQVVVRYFFNSPNPYTEALSKHLFVWLVLFAGAYVFGLREHMNIGYLRSKMPEKVALIVEMLCEGVLGLFAGWVLAYGGWLQSIKQMSQLDAALQIPIGIIYRAVPISGMCILFYVLYNEVELLKKIKNLKK
ncbi:MAG: TRAP transporter small permease [Anaerotignaceae bacterium]